MDKIQSSETTYQRPDPDLEYDFDRVINELDDHMFDPRYKFDLAACKNLLIRTYNLFGNYGNYSKLETFPKELLLLYACLVRFTDPVKYDFGEKFEACQFVAREMLWKIRTDEAEDFSNGRILKFINRRTGPHNGFLTDDDLIFFNIDEFDLDLIIKYCLDFD